MYTVFILPHRTLDSYHQFEVLMNTEDKSRLFGICPWKMEATTVETALPDLYRLVRAKETWRAIVILDIMSWTGTGKSSRAEFRSFGSPT